MPRLGKNVSLLVYTQNLNKFIQTKCFTDWLKNHNQLRWGNSFNDPVHIDDGINLRDRARWDKHFYDNQSCRK